MHLPSGLCYTLAMKKNVLVMVSPMCVSRVGGVARYAKEHGWHLMIQDRLGYNPLAWNGDGIIATLRRDHAMYGAVNSFLKRGIPIVDLTAERPDIDVPRVTSDHVGIGRLAAAHFHRSSLKSVIQIYTAAAGSCVILYFCVSS